MVREGPFLNLCWPLQVPPAAQSAEVPRTPGSRHTLTTGSSGSRTAYPRPWPVRTPTRNRTGNPQIKSLLLCQIELRGCVHLYSTTGMPACPASFTVMSVPCESWPAGPRVHPSLVQGPMKARHTSGPASTIALFRT